MKTKLLKPFWLAAMLLLLATLPLHAKQSETKDSDYVYTMLVSDLFGNSSNNLQPAPEVSANGFTFSFDQGNSQISPMYHARSRDLRLYGGTETEFEGNTMTVSSDVNFTTIVFSGVSCWFNSGEELRASNGTVVYDGLETLVWTGSTTNVVFTVCGDGASSTQFCFTKITVSNLALESMVPAPTFTPAAGTFYVPLNVTIEPDTVAVYYTLDGSTPTRESASYAGPIYIDATTTLKAIADYGYTMSEVVTAEYVIGNSTSVPNIAAYKSMPDNTVVVFSNPVTVLGHNSNNLYVKDDSGYAYFYGNAGVNYKTGDIIPAGFSGEKVTNGGEPELLIGANSNFQHASGTEIVNPDTIQVADVDASMFGHYVYIVGATLDPSFYTITDNSGTCPYYTGMSIDIDSVNPNTSYNVWAMISSCEVDNQTVYRVLPMKIIDVNGGPKNIAEYLALPENEEFFFSGEVVVTYRDPNNKRYLYIKDETGSAVFYGSNFEFNQGDVLAGGWTGKKTNYRGLYQISNAQGFVTTGQTLNVEPVEMTVNDIVPENQNIYCIIKNVKITNVSGRNFKIGGAAGYNTFYNTVTLPTDETVNFDVMGIISVYSNNPQFIPTFFIEKSYDFIVDGIAYKYNDDGITVSVTYKYDQTTNNYSGLTTANIPASVAYNGITYSVTSVGKNAFSGCTSLTDVTVPNSVTSIGENAFSGCSGLTTVNWNATAFTDFSYDNSPFKDLTSITTFIISDEIERIPAYLCYGLSGLTSVTIPNSVTSIGEGAFFGCSGLSSVAIPDNVTTIVAGAFMNCSGLTGELLIPNSVTFIDYRAFMNCSALTSIIVGNSVDSIGTSAFAACSNLRSMTWNAKHCADFGAASGGYYPLFKYNNNGNWVGEPTNLTDFTFGSEVEHIPSYLCIDLTSLQRVYNHINHPSDVTVGDHLFRVVGTLYVTKGRVEEYQAVEPWSYFNIEEGDWFIPATGIEISNTSLSLFAYQTAQFNIQTVPADASYQQFNWQTSNDEIASVDQDGMVIAHKVGTATITATTIDGTDLSVTCEVTVNGTTSLSLNKNETFIYVTSSETLIPAIEPAEMASAPLLWQSSDPTVADVDQNGLVTALAPGTATITATTTDGTELSASCQVTTNYEYALMADTIKHTRGEDAVSIEYPVELINTNTVSGLQFEVQLPENVTLLYDDVYADVWLDDARKGRDHSIQVDSLGNNHFLFMISSATNKELKGHDGTLFYMNLLVDQYHNAGIYDINFTNLTLTEANETEHTGLNTTSAVQFNYMLGDADADATVDVADHTTTLLHILTRPTIRFYEDAANVHAVNPAINVTDLVGIANIALGIHSSEILHAPALNGTMPSADMEPEMDMSIRCVDAGRWIMSLNLSNSQPMAAMQLDLQLPDGMTIDDATLAGRASNLQLSTGTLDDGSTRLLASAFTDAEIEPGNDAVLNLLLKGNPVAEGMATFRNIIVAERNLNSYQLEMQSIPFVPTVIDDIIAYNEVRIYGENGNVVIESPVAGTAQLVLINGISTPLKVQPGRNVYPVNNNGFYIVRFNSTTAKIKF